MRCIFVLDLFNGEVVHAVRGERSHYQPIHRFSKVVTTSDPLEIIDALRPVEVYIADLDRITGVGDNLAVLAILASKVRTMADIGISWMEEIASLPAAAAMVLGTETVSLDLIKRASSLRTSIVSIDMMKRRVLTRDAALDITPEDLLRKLNDLPVAEVIMLELDRVGTSAGIDIQFLENAAMVSEHPLILGGGVRDESDLERLAEIGFSGALVATAVHNGMMPAARLE